MAAHDHENEREALRREAQYIIDNVFDLINMLIMIDKDPSLFQAAGAGASSSYDVY